MSTWGMHKTMWAVHLLHILTLMSTLGSKGTAMGHKPLLNNHLKVAAEVWRPYMIFYCNGKIIEESEICSDQGKLTYGGALWDFLQFIKRARNATFSILRPPTPTWGFCHSASNCSGMIDMVQRREVDFALGI